MEEPRYTIECFSSDSIEHGLPESTRTCVSPHEVAEIVASCTRQASGITELRITIDRAEPDWDWAKYWRLEAQICREYEHRFCDEIAKRLPSIRFMSFAGPEAIVNWIFQNVEIKKSGND